MFLNYCSERLEIEINEKNMMMKITNSGRKIVVTLEKILKESFWWSRIGFLSRNTKYFEHEC